MHVKTSTAGFGAESPKPAVPGPKHVHAPARRINKIVLEKRVIQQTRRYALAVIRDNTPNHPIPLLTSSLQVSTDTLP
jgi:hypothetical protein